MVKKTIFTRSLFWIALAIVPPQHNVSSSGWGERISISVDLGEKQDVAERTRKKREIKKGIFFTFSFTK